MVTAFTYKPSLVRIDACNFELSWQQTHPHKHTHRQDRFQYTVLQLASKQCNYLHLKMNRKVKYALISQLQTKHKPTTTTTTTTTSSFCLTSLFYWHLLHVGPTPHTSSKWDYLYVIFSSRMPFLSCHPTNNVKALKESVLYKHSITMINKQSHLKHNC